MRLPPYIVTAQMQGRQTGFPGSSCLGPLGDRKRDIRRKIRKENGPPPTGYDYDEFPYASTKQGGKGAHVEPVPSSENQEVGRELGVFYLKNHIGEGDKFDIRIVE